MFEARDLRVDERGSPCIDGLSFSSTGERLLVLGGPRELMRAAAGLAPIARGELVVDGLAPAEALADGGLASAMFDAPMPPSMTPLAWVTWSARLAGLPKSEAAAAAAENLARCGVTLAQSKAALKRQSPVVRRATQLAAALVPNSATLVLWDPLADLEPESADVLGRVLAAVLADRRVLVFAGRAAVSGALASLSTELIVLSHSKVVAQGTVADVAVRDRTFVVRALGNLDVYQDELTRRGARVVRKPGAGELSIELGRMENADIFRAAVATGATVLEMRPAVAAVLS